MEPILDRLILGNLSEATDPFLLERHHVDAIIYFGDGGFFPEEIKLYHRPAGPDGSLSADQVNDGVEFLRESLRRGRRVLAVGSTGATLIAAFLAEMGYNPERALRMVTVPRSPRPDAERLRLHTGKMFQRARICVQPIEADEAALCAAG